VKFVLIRENSKIILSFIPTFCPANPEAIPLAKVAKSPGMLRFDNLSGHALRTLNLPKDTFILYPLAFGLWSFFSSIKHRASNSQLLIILSFILWPLAFCLFYPSSSIEHLNPNSQFLIRNS
jgi:hypothetical protein